MSTLDVKKLNEVLSEMDDWEETMSEVSINRSNAASLWQASPEMKAKHAASLKKALAQLEMKKKSSAIAKERCLKPVTLNGLVFATRYDLIKTLGKKKVGGSHDPALRFLTPEKVQWWKDAGRPEKMDF